MIYLDQRQRFIAVILGLVLLIILVLFLFSEQIFPNIYRMVDEMVFEVVIKKPVDDKIVYDKEIDRDLIPFHIRNDEYYSIGTAFAISKTECITAFHVLSFFSLVNDTFLFVIPKEMFMKLIK